MSGTIDARFCGTLGQFSLDAAFSVPAQGVTGLFGPSGCGKTTVLRAIAGLERLKGSSFVFKGEIWQDAHHFRPAHKRPIGYVFQEASLFPHLTVKRNLLFGASTLHGFDEAVDLLGLSALLERKPHRLSGGERQRVAIGRALLSSPQLLLMDEPLSALDHNSRDEILPYLERLSDQTSLPLIYVSHDSHEIERLADQLILMQKGQVLCTGPLNKLQTDLALPLALRREAASSFTAIVEQIDDDGMVRASVTGGSFWLAAKASLGETHRLTIAASDVSLSLTPATNSTIVNILPARIKDLRATGEGAYIVVLALGENGEGETLLARITARSQAKLQLKTGMALYAQVKSVRLN